MLGTIILLAVIVFRKPLWQMIDGLLWPALTEKPFKGIIITCYGRAYALYPEAREQFVGWMQAKGYKNPYQDSPDFFSLPWTRSTRKKLPDSITIINQYSRLLKSPTLHNEIFFAASCNADCGSYYQDGRIEFKENQLHRMRLFVEHCTTLNLKTWDAMVAQAPKDGPGFIVAVASFCHPNPTITNRPNIGNALIGLHKNLQKEKMTEGEQKAYNQAMAVPEIANTTEKIKHRIRIQGLKPANTAEIARTAQEMCNQHEQQRQERINRK